MLPQLGQAWQLPERIIATPHCMHIGAPSSTGRTMPLAAVLSTAVATVRPSCICVESSPAEGTYLGSEGISEPWLVTVTASSTPGSVGCSRSFTEKIPSSARSS